jgi:shikimate dehydrogenase
MPPPLAGVVGFPVGHSRSPAMMNAAFRELGLDWLYLPLPLEPERFDGTIRALGASGFRGVNVTVPHKLAAHAVADRRSAAAEAIGAANTLTFEGGRIEADNTDAGGLLAALGDAAGGARALVLGAGGAGRAAAWALREAGAREVTVWNRTAERAAALAAELGVRQAQRPEPSDLLVNATSVGLGGETERQVVEALALEGLVPPPLLVELVYGEGPTALTKWAERGGSRVVDGLEVLVRQGALSFERWTGADAPLETMRRAARGDVQGTLDG